MATHWISFKNNINEENKENSERFFLFPKKLRFNNNIKLKPIPISNMPSKRINLSIKLNDPLRNMISKRKNKCKSTNISLLQLNCKDLFIKNYTNKEVPAKIPINPTKIVPNKILNVAYHLNNSFNENPKKILPKIRRKDLIEPIVQRRGISVTGRKKMKKISLIDLFNDKTELDYDHYLTNNNTVDKIQLKNNKKYHAESEWNLFKDNEKEYHYSNQETSFIKKFPNTKGEIINVNKETEEKCKNGAERLKDIHAMKIRECNKYIKQMRKETEEKRKVLSKYLKLMRSNVESSLEFDSKFNYQEN